MITCLLAVSVLGGKSQAQDLLSNVYGRDYQLLNGKWGAIVDLYDQGERMQVYKNRKPQDNKQFYEYSFDGGLVLKGPSDCFSAASITPRSSSVASAKSMSLPISIHKCPS